MLLFWRKYAFKTVRASYKTNCCCGSLPVLYIFFMRKTIGSSLAHSKSPVYNDQNVQHVQRSSVWYRWAQALLHHTIIFFPMHKRLPVVPTERANTHTSSFDVRSPREHTTPTTLHKIQEKKTFHLTRSPSRRFCVVFASFSFVFYRNNYAIGRQVRVVVRLNKIKLAQMVVASVPK